MVVLYLEHGLTCKELIIVLVMAFSVIPLDLVRKLLFKRKGVVDYI